MVKNEEGYVKCLTKQGNVRWIGDHIATNSKRMKNMDLTIAPSPIKLEPMTLSEKPMNSDVEDDVQVFQNEIESIEQPQIELIEEEER